MFRNQRQIRILLRHGDGIVCITAAFTGDHPNGITCGQVVVRKDKVRFRILFGHLCTSGKHHHIVIGAVGGEGATVCNLESALMLGAGAAAIHTEYRNATRTGDIHRAISANDHLPTADAAIALDRQRAVDGDNGIRVAGGSDVDALHGVQHRALCHGEAHIAAYALDSQRRGAGDLYRWTIVAAYRNRVYKALLAHNDFDFPAACIRQGQRSGQRQTVQGQGLCVRVPVVAVGFQTALICVGAAQVKILHLVIPKFHTLIGVVCNARTAWHLYQTGAGQTQPLYISRRGIGQ